MRPFAAVSAKHLDSFPGGTEHAVAFRGNVIRGDRSFIDGYARPPRRPVKDVDPTVAGGGI